MWALTKTQSARCHVSEWKVLELEEETGIQSNNNVTMQ
jgi:hypothetical protein